MPKWQSYECFGLNYRLLSIESMDSDTETRRLSPVAVLGDGYVDLINGKNPVESETEKKQGFSVLLLSDRLTTCKT